MIQTIEICPGVTLRCCQDDRFKQGSLSIQFLRPMCREEAPLNALIPAVLLRGCEGAADLQAITRRLDDLYGAAVGSAMRRVGDYQATGLACSFIEDRFALTGDRILEPMIDFLFRLLLQPVREEGVFCRDYVESEKRNLILSIQAMRNDKRSYANNRMLEEMCAGDSYAVPRLGRIEEAQAITAESAFDHYRRLLKESPVHIFYVGSAEPQRIAALLQPKCAGLAEKAVCLPGQTVFSGGTPGHHQEVMDVNQGKLAMGFTTSVSIRDSGFAAMQVLNVIFGGGMTSKLFMNIREKNSLCYEIGSVYHGTKAILTVSAGIDPAQDKAVEAQVLEQLEACRRGEFTEEELDCAKQVLISQLQGTHDSPGAIEGYYAAGALSGLGLTPGEYMAAVEAVTPEALAEAAKGVQLHTVYFLKGVQ